MLQPHNFYYNSNTTIKTIQNPTAIFTISESPKKACKLCLGGENFAIHVGLFISYVKEQPKDNFF